jgi:hypothetical protein
MAPFAYALPEPSAALFHPVKLYPERVKLLVVSAVALPDVSVSLAIVPEPPLALKLTV